MVGSAVETLAEDLAEVNAQLWEVEDALRVCERDGEFGPRFVALARSVYTLNDQRAALKRLINRLFDSALVEEKELQKASPGRRSVRTPCGASASASRVGAAGAPASFLDPSNAVGDFALPRGPSRACERRRPRRPVRASTPSSSGAGAGPGRGGRRIRGGRLARR